MVSNSKKGASTKLKVRNVLTGDRCTACKSKEKGRAAQETLKMEGRRTLEDGLQENKGMKNTILESKTIPLHARDRKVKRIISTGK